MNLFPKDTNDTKSEAFKLAYELAKQQGDKRFGSDCKHEHVKNGKCLDCLRKVIG